MTDRATTPEQVVAAVSNWNIGVGPDELHIALGWTPAELERYQQTGDLPEEQTEHHEAETTIELEGPTPALGNPFLEGVIATFPAAVLKEPVHHRSLARTEDRSSRAIPEVPDGFWNYYTRWRALPTGDGQWKVLGEHGEEDREGPRRHDDQASAQKRADELNSAEQSSAITRGA